MMIVLSITQSILDHFVCTLALFEGQTCWVTDTVPFWPGVHAHDQKVFPTNPQNPKRLRKIIGHNMWLNIWSKWYSTSHYGPGTGTAWDTHGLSMHLPTYNNWNCFKNRKFVDNIQCSTTPFHTQMYSTISRRTKPHIRTELYTTIG